MKADAGSVLAIAVLDLAVYIAVTGVTLLLPLLPGAGTVLGSGSRGRVLEADAIAMAMCAGAEPDAAVARSSW